MTVNSSVSLTSIGAVDRRICCSIWLMTAPEADPDAEADDEPPPSIANKSVAMLLLPDDELEAPKPADPDDPKLDD